MASKPASVPRWANVGGDIEVPTSGKQDIGWVGAERPPAQFLNWLLNLAFQWIDWLNDGDVQFDTIDANDGDTVILTDGASGDDDVDVTVQGTGLVKHHGEVTRVYSAMTGEGVTGSTITNSNEWGGAAGSGIFYPVFLAIGERIKGAVARVGVGSGSTCTIELFRKPHGSAVQIGSSGTSTGEVPQDITVGAISYVGVADEQYALEVSTAGGTGSFSHIEITTDWPIIITASLTYNDDDGGGDSEITGADFRKIKAGDTVVVTGTSSNDASYTADADGTKTTLTLTGVVLTDEGPVSSTVTV